MGGVLRTQGKYDFDLRIDFLAIFLSFLWVFWFGPLMLLNTSSILKPKEVLQALGVLSKFQNITLTHSGVMQTCLIIFMDFQDQETWAELRARQMQNPYFKRFDKQKILWSSTCWWKKNKNWDFCLQLRLLKPSVTRW